MSSPLQFLNHSNPGRLATAQSKGPHKAKPSEVRHLSAYTSRKNSPGKLCLLDVLHSLMAGGVNCQACFDPPLEVVHTKNPVMGNRRTADPVHPDLAGLLVKNKHLLAEEIASATLTFSNHHLVQLAAVNMEATSAASISKKIMTQMMLRNLRNKLFIKETSLQEMKSELESYKENNVQQSFQIMSLKDDIKDLEELIASLTRIKSLKNINIHSLERGNWDLTERIMELEKLLRVHLIERKKAELKAELLEKKFAAANRFTPCMSMKEQEDSLDSFKTKRAEGLQQEVQMLTKQLEKQCHHCEETAGESSDNEEKYKEQKRPLKRLKGKTAINDLFQRRLDLDMKKENSWTKISQMDEHGKTFKRLEKDNKQETLLNIQQNLQVVTTQRLEEKIQKLQKQLSDLKLSNKNMKTQLTRVNVLKDKTIEKLRQSLTKVETMKGKAVMETDLKTTVDSAEQEARWDKERPHQMSETVTPELCRTKSTLEDVLGQQEEIVDFREAIMKTLGFNLKTADKKIINHLRLIIQVYGASDRSRIASECETGQDKE